VPKGRARFRLQVMANHQVHDIAEAVRRLSAATVAAQAEDEALKNGTLSLAGLEPQIVLMPAEAAIQPERAKREPKAIAAEPDRQIERKIA